MRRRLAAFRELTILLIVLASVPVHAAGTLSKHTTTWKGITRYYAVYRPQSLAPNPSMVLFLNPTSQNAANEPPYLNPKAWESLADQHGFLMVWPLSSYNTATHSWYWQCYETDSTFPQLPDDAGFLRWLITSLQSQYGVIPGRTFVTGMSSGGFMAHRVGMDLSDIVAGIAPVSGMIDIHPIGQDYTPPRPTFPVSVYQLQGDQDPVVAYCGKTSWFWGALHDVQPSSDDSVNFWATADSCTKRSTQQPLCTDGSPTAGVDGIKVNGCSEGTAVIFEREVGVGHLWVEGTESKVWAFFQSHPRP